MLSPSTDAFTIGQSRIPASTACAKKGMNVSFAPLRFSQSARSRSRSFTMRVILISKIECTCALVRFDATMCSAIFLRMVDIGTRSPGITIAGAGTVGTGWRATAAAGRPPADAAAGDPAGCSSTKRRMSSLVMRPPRPLPETCARSTLWSRAMRRTSGDDRTRCPSSPDGNSMTVSSSAAAASRCLGGSGGETGCGRTPSPLRATASVGCGWRPRDVPSACGLGAGGAGAVAAAFGASGLAGAGAAAAPSASITPTTVFTCTVAPSATLISLSTPEAGAGISASTLSVEISNKGSSR